MMPLIPTPTPGFFYKHYKGGIYFCMFAEVKHTETGEIGVLLYNLEHETPHFRPRAVWDEPAVIETKHESGVLACDQLVYSRKLVARFALFDMPPIPQMAGLPECGIIRGKAVPLSDFEPDGANVEDLGWGV